MIRGTPAYHRALAAMFEYPDPYQAPLAIVFEVMLYALEEAHKLQADNDRLRGVLRDIHDHLVVST